MRQKLKVVITVMLFAYSISSVAQPTTLSKFTKEDFINDIRLAMDILKKQHPNPYKFIDSVSYNHKVDSLLKKMSEQKDILACNQFSPIGLLRDVHTNIAYQEETSREIMGKINYFPFPVMIERGKILVNIKGEAIPYGAEIININKMPARRILDIISSSSYSDGFITTGTDRVFADFQLKFGMANNEIKTYNIEYTVPGGKDIKEISLPSIGPAEGYHSRNKAIMPVNLLQRAYYIYGEYNDANESGILTVNSFNFQEAYAYKEFSSFFKEVNKRKYKNVIIDIRNNGGGNPAISALLYSFISKSSFKNQYNQRTKTIDIAYPEYVVDGERVYSEEDIRGTKDFLYQRFDKDSAKNLYVGNDRLKEGLLENFPADKDGFSENVYVLTGGGTVSAAAYFAELVQKYKRGIIVGKETGSGEQSTTAMWFLKYRLPKTKMILTIPMSELYFFNASTDNGRGVIPDKEVPMEKFLEYMRATKDPELNYTYELIKKKN